MKLLVFVLNKEELLGRILEAYMEAGITGATILDSEGMGHFLVYEKPLIPGLQTFMKGHRPYNKTILSVISDESVIPRVVHLINDICGGFRESNTGILFTVPVDFTVGLLKPDAFQADGAPP